MRSARSASSVVCEVKRGPSCEEWWCGWCPAAPSLIATTDSAEREVVPLLGVPGPCSLGVVGSDIGGGTRYVSNY